MLLFQLALKFEQLSGTLLRTDSIISGSGFQLPDRRDRQRPPHPRHDRRRPRKPTPVARRQHSGR